MTAYTQRVKVGAFYTDGQRLAEVIEVNALGYVCLRDAATGERIGCGIDAFRRRWWIARSPAPSEATR
jgi:hypothetical protein